MQEFQQRVVDEKTELDGKRERLYAFISGEKIKALPIEEKADLISQYNAMTRYSSILESRITRFTKELNFTAP